MSYLISGKDSNLHISVLADGYRIKIVDKFAGAAASAGQLTNESGFYCPIDFSHMEEVGYYSFNFTTGKYTVWDEQLGKIYDTDLSTDEKVQKFFSQWETLIVPEDLKKVSDLISAVKQTGEYRVTYRVKLPSGKEKTIVACGIVIYDENNKPQTLMVINQAR